MQKRSILESVTNLHVGSYDPLRLEHTGAHENDAAARRRTRQRPRQPLRRGAEVLADHTDLRFDRTVNFVRNFVPPFTHFIPGLEVTY